MKKHQHIEAFCLMWYRCDECEHSERIWNSRDGVTPFSMNCPSCGCLALMHWRFNLDEYAPDHALNIGQRYWRDGTLQEARAILERRFALFSDKGQAVPENIKTEMFADLDRPSKEREGEFQDGWPTIDTYTRHLATASSA